MIQERQCKEKLNAKHSKGSNFEGKKKEEQILPNDSTTLNTTPSSTS